ncbi:MAG TPA: pyridoxamine 5'-phosphate oxidase family protein [Mycobacteriales bacterium]|nr:pyridoxamine 5'-phosphate oxidase family protein [Mycobacteriales bacterium]
MVVQVGRSALSDAQSVGLLGSTRRGRLITTLNALPAAEPVPFVADGRQVVVRIATPNSVRDGDVLSLQVDDIDARTGAGWSVLVTGSARRVPRGDPLVERLGERATEDWLDRTGELVLLANPLVRGVAIDPSGTPAATPAGPGRGDQRDQRDGPDRTAGALHRAVALAARAPSVHDARPWRWEVTVDGLNLYTDPGRRPSDPYLHPDLDPDPDLDRRARLVSCGAGLQHARTALLAAGWAVRTLTFPGAGDPDHDPDHDPENDPDHIARLLLVGRAVPEDRDLRLADAAANRRTDPRPLGTQPVPADRMTELVAAARFEDAELYPVTDPDAWSRLAGLIARADLARTADPAYQARPAGGAAARPSGPAGAHPPTIGDPVAPAAAGVRLDRGPAGHPALAVLCTSGNGRRDWLRAGEATARVLLVAEVHGLSASPLTAPMEVPGARATLRDLTDAGEPQVVLRIGVPAEATG